VDADLIPNEILDVYRTASRIERDGIELMRREFLDDMAEHWQVGREMGNGGNVLSLRKRDCDVEEHRTSPAETVSERRDEDPDTMTFVSTTERAQAHLLERITILMETDDHLDPNILTIGGLGNMQNTHRVESLGDQEDVVRVLGRESSVFLHESN